jgi:ATP-dependent DNA helicase RecG
MVSAMAGDLGFTTIQQLQLLPEDQRVPALRKRPESQWFDRKSARVKPRELADAMVAFANAEGGLIAVGIWGGAIEGMGPDERLHNGWRQAGRDFARPPVPAHFEVVPCINERGDADRLLIIEIDASEHVHENVRGEVLLRIGDENRRLGPMEVQELHYDKGGTFFDGTPAPGAAGDDLDPNLIDRFLRSVGGRQRPDDALLARGLLVRSRGQLLPTVAGILTLGSDPQRFLPEARVRLLRYQGSVRETGERSNVVSDVQGDGALRDQILFARRTLRRWLGAAIRLGPSGRFRRTTLIPEKVWLEAIVNAVVHRSYSVGGDHIRVSLFADRLEVESPGRLPGLVRIETIRSTRFARNPRVARAVLEFGFGRELGEGVDRMFEDMEQAGLPDPVYRQGPASVTVALLMDPIGARMRRLLPQGSERFVEFVLGTERVTTAQAKELLGVSVNTARRYLAALADAGYLQHESKSARDPHGYWRLTTRTDDPTGR